MAYFNEIREIVKETKKDYFVVEIRRHYFVIEGVLKIITYTPEDFVVQLKKTTMAFHGESFKIVKSNKDEIVVKGVLLSYKVDYET